MNYVFIAFITLKNVYEKRKNLEKVYKDISLDNT